jgi:glycosyltransferase involved in cell wall biosynthesis
VSLGDSRRSLKILHIDPERAWGGGERQVLGLLDYLSLRNHHNHLLCDPEGLLCLKAQKREIAVFPITVWNEFDLRAIFSIRRLIQREQYDIVHFHTKRAHALALWLGRPHPIARYVVTRRMDYPIGKNWYNHCLYNRQVDGIVAISGKIAEVLLEAGVKREKIRIIHSGIDATPFLELQETKRTFDLPVIGTVASIEERKGHRFLLEAAAHLKRQGLHAIYRLAGEGGGKKSFKKMASELGLEGEVIFMGFVPDIPAFLSKIDLFVLSSVYEGLGVAILEAMAAGKPVIATKVGGVPELIEDRVSGLLVPAGDPGALARAISQMLSDKAGMKRMGERARERVRSHFTIEQMAKQNEDYYYELLAAQESKNLTLQEVGRVGS